MAKKKEKFQAVDEDMLISLIQEEASRGTSRSLDSLAIQRVESNKAFVNDWTSRTTPMTGMSGVNFYFTPSVVNTLTMYMSKIFCSDKDTVQMIPSRKDPQSQAGVDQLQKMCNEVIHKQNRGFDILTGMFRSAAVNKNAVAKVVWDEEPEFFEETMTDKSEQELAVIIQEIESKGFEVEVIDSEVTVEMVVEQAIDPTTGEPISIERETSRGSYTLRMTRMKSGIRIDVLPPEEFIINEDTTDIHCDLTRYVAHQREMFKGDIQAKFPNVDVSELSSDEGDNRDWEKDARHYFDGSFDFGDDEGNSAEATQKITITESWIRADVDGDGFPEWRHVFSAGSTILEEEEWFGPLPFTSFTFFPVPHKFYGLSVYDRIRPYEETATSLVRSDVDMARLRNTFRLFAREGSVDRRNLQSGKPGVIPVSNTFDAKDVLPVPAPVGANNVPAILAELRQQVIADVGIDPVSGQVSTDIEKSGNDAAKTSMVIDNASVKIEGYARRFAEGALRDLTWLIAVELVKHSESSFVMELVESTGVADGFIADQLGLYKLMNKTGITAKVGLGHQTDAQKAQATAAVLPILQLLSQDPSDAIYNLAAEALRGFQYENPEDVLGPLEFYQQKAQLAQQAQMAQIQQGQAAQQQLALQQQIAQAELALRQQETEAKIQREAAESQAKIELMKAQAMEKTAAAADKAIDAEIKAEGPGQGSEVSFDVNV